MSLLILFYKYKVDFLSHQIFCFLNLYVFVFIVLQIYNKVLNFQIYFKNNIKKNKDENYNDKWKGILSSKWNEKGRNKKMFSNGEINYRNVNRMEYRNIV